VQQAQAPGQPTPDPNPPSPTQAARIAGEAWNDPDWGMLVWLAMTTGARRGELCALRWDHIDFVSGVITIRTSIAQINTRTWEKNTKTHQRRRIVLDAQTLALLRAYLQHVALRAASLGIELSDGSFVFSAAPDGATWLKPDTVTQRYSRMCERLGWDMHIHQLRHYSATELIAAGVDIRTVAGRLGHGGGGTTTLRVYSAWVAEADQRAASSLAAHARIPVSASGGDGAPALPAATSAHVDTDDSPYRQIASDLRAAIRCGAIQPGDHLPTGKALAERYLDGPIAFREHSSLRSRSSWPVRGFSFLVHVVLIFWFDHRCTRWGRAAVYQTGVVWRRGEPARAATFAAAVLAAVLSPLVQYRRPLGERVDGFPLSWYPMFSAKRRRRAWVTHAVGVTSGGGWRYLPCAALGPGGINQVRRQLYRVVVTERRADAYVLALAERVATRRDCADLVGVEVWRTRFDLDECLLNRTVQGRHEVLARASLPRSLRPAAGSW